MIGAGGAVDLSDGASPFLQVMTDLNGAGLLTNSAIGFALLTVNSVNTDTYSGIISGPINLQKEGSGTLILAGANSYTGTTAVNAGALRIQNASGLGNALAGATVASGAALEIQGGVAVAAAPLAIRGLRRPRSLHP